MLNNLKRLPADTVYTTMRSPVGELWLLASESGLHCILWELDMNNAGVREFIASIKRLPSQPILARAKQQLAEYFAGSRTQFDLPLAPMGTEFQLKAWMQLRKIPFGRTISYAEQARQMGDPKKARAVGTANSRNPLSIIVPCHRVIASSGALSGFGGGVAVKQFLLRHEGCAPN